jgi:hypothetical protein
MKKSLRTLTVVSVLFLAGCAAHQIHPGTSNSFDSATYDTLMVTDNVIQSTKADLAANKFPASIAGNVKTALNDLITAYDAADIAYCDPQPGTTLGSLQCSPASYHAAVNSASGATNAQQALVSNALAKVNTATAALATAKGGS